MIHGDNGMNSILLSDNFCFLNITFSEYHYTDNRKGSPLNFLAYMIKGTAKIVSDAFSINIKEGDVFYIPKGLGYQSYWYGEDINFLSFGFANLYTPENVGFELQVVDCGEDIAEKIRLIPTQGNDVDCKTLSAFYTAMSEVIPLLTCTTNRNDITVKKIKDCICKYPFSSLSEIAHMCGISEPTLYLVFKRAESITPNEYRQKILCDMGVKLLVTTDKKVEDISNTLGFSSSSYFRKVLKKITGKTPREIRKENVF